MKKRGRQLASRVGHFARVYRRKKPGGMAEPNDRKYDRKLEALVKRLPPEELDRLLRGDDDSTAG